MPAMPSIKCIGIISVSSSEGMNKGEGKRGEGGNLAGTSHGEGYCEERAFLGYLRGQSENVDI